MTFVESLAEISRNFEKVLPYSRIAWIQVLFDTNENSRNRRLTIQIVGTML